MEDYKKMPDKSTKPTPPSSNAPGGPIPKIDPTQVGPCWLWIYAFKSMFSSAGSKAVGCFGPIVSPSPPVDDIPEVPETSED